jgi:hypothetical protein
LYSKHWNQILELIYELPVARACCVVSSTISPVEFRKGFAACTD